MDVFVPCLLSAFVSVGLSCVFLVDGLESIGDGDKSDKQDSMCELGVLSGVKLVLLILLLLLLLLLSSLLQGLELLIGVVYVFVMGVTPRISHALLFRMNTTRCRTETMWRPKRADQSLRRQSHSSEWVVEKRSWHSVEQKYTCAQSL